MIDREGAYVALVSILQTKLGGLLASPVVRKLPSYADLDSIAQPLVAIIAGRDSLPSDGPEPERPTLHAIVVIYARADVDPNATAETTLFGIVGTIDDALNQNAQDLPNGSSVSPGQTIQGWTSLGGKALWAKPGGEVLYDSGQTENQGIAQYPIDIVMVPA